MKEKLPFSRMQSDFKSLLTYFNKDDEILIQTHDYPDHDAVGSAYGLMYLFKYFGFANIKIVYFNSFNNFSLDEAVEHFKINLHNLDEEKDLLINEEAKLILVDSYLGNFNVTSIDANYIAIIDHHEAFSNICSLCSYQDIREDYGACSSIIFNYFIENGVSIPEDVASMFLMGVVVDTSYLSRGVSKADIMAYNHFYFIAQSEYVINLLKNSLSVSYISMLKEAMEEMELEDGYCFTCINKECTLDILAIMADFFLSLKEVKFSVVLALYKGDYRISVRSNEIKYPTDLIIKSALDGIGQGGGHAYMGAGTIEKESFTSIQDLHGRFKVALQNISKRLK